MLIAGFSLISSRFMFNRFDLLFAIVTAIGVFAFISVVGVWFVKRQKASKLGKVRFWQKCGFPVTNSFEARCGLINAHSRIFVDFFTIYVQQIWSFICNRHSDRSIRLHLSSRSVVCQTLKSVEIGKIAFWAKIRFSQYKLIRNKIRFFQCSYEPN
jgi:hypothetical protein